MAQENPRIGTWKLNLAESTYQEGHAPSSETRTYVATDDGGIQLTANALLPSGTKQPSGFRAKYDGKDYPYSGPAGDTIAITGNGWAANATIKMGSKITQTSHSVVFANGRTMSKRPRQPAAIQSAPGSTTNNKKDAGRAPQTGSAPAQSPSRRASLAFRHVDEREIRDRRRNQKREVGGRAAS